MEMLRRNGPVVKSVESVLRLEGSLWGERFVEEVGLEPGVKEWNLNPSSHSATTDMGQKLGWGLCPFGGGGAGSLLNTVWPGPWPTCMPVSSWAVQPFGHNTVKYTNVTDRQRQTGQEQRSDSIGSPENWQLLGLCPSPQFSGMLCP